MQAEKREIHRRGLEAVGGMPVASLHPADTTKVQ